MKTKKIESQQLPSLNLKHASLKVAQKQDSFSVPGKVSIVQSMEDVMVCSVSIIRHQLHQLKLARTKSESASNVPLISESSNGR